jgi:translocation and assembly module TamA
LVPIEDRIYLGGDDSLRGFRRQSINNNGLGFLTSIYIGFELRLIEELPYHLQPFLLWDGARVGNRRYTVDLPLFTSEGIGLRWASPFGTLRGSAARGHVFDSDASTAGFTESWVYFFSFGQEF